MTCSNILTVVLIRPSSSSWSEKETGANPQSRLYKPRPRSLLEYVWVYERFGMYWMCAKSLVPCSAFATRLSNSMHPTNVRPFYRSFIFFLVTGIHVYSLHIVCCFVLGPCSTSSLRVQKRPKLDLHCDTRFSLQ